MTAEVPADVASRLAAVRERVAAACAGVGREVAGVTIVAVTKTHGPDAAQAAVDAGCADLGENRVQEWRAKAPLVHGARWHLVGPLQVNKVRHVVGHGVLLHAIDRAEQLVAIGRRAQNLDADQQVLLQVNVADDPAKHGCTADDLGPLLEQAHRTAGVEVIGLMTVPPLPDANADPNDATRPHFARLRALRDRHAADHPGLRHLSMGMTADLEAALAEGATLVRLGTAIFGPRQTGPWRPDDDKELR